MEMQFVTKGTHGENSDAEYMCQLRNFYSSTKTGKSEGTESTSKRGIIGKGSNYTIGAIEIQNGKRPTKNLS